MLDKKSDKKKAISVKTAHARFEGKRPPKKNVRSRQAGRGTVQLRPRTNRLI